MTCAASDHGSESNRAASSQSRGHALNKTSHLAPPNRPAAGSAGPSHRGGSNMALLAWVRIHCLPLYRGKVSTAATRPQSPAQDFTPSPKNRALHLLKAYLKVSAISPSEAGRSVFASGRFTMRPRVVRSGNPTPRIGCEDHRHGPAGCAPHRGGCCSGPARPVPCAARRTPDRGSPSSQA